MQLLLQRLRIVARILIPSRYKNSFFPYMQSAGYRTIRRDLKEIHVQEHVVFHVFWKDIEKVGRGPALSFIAYNEEVLRLDCFGPGDGHLHACFLTPGGQAVERLMFPEQDIPAQIDRAVFELKTNWRYYATRHVQPEVRQLKIDSECWQNAVDKARIIMLELATKVV